MIALILRDLGVWQGVYDILSKPFDAFMVFVQELSILVATAMVAFYKIKSMYADVQEDQMYHQKATKVLKTLLFIFLIPTIIRIMRLYFF